MRFRSVLLVAFVSMLPIAAIGQKVKYKDLFVLLNAKQYDQAAPFLKKYLQDNTDNPNAHLFMGIILQERSNDIDVLRRLDSLTTTIDSAVHYYDLAYKGIDDRELRKNDEYYQAYNRRDLRTGKFGVTLSDVQLDLEKRIEGLKERRQRAVLLNKQLETAESSYAKANFLYKDLQISYKDLTSLYLRSDQKTIVDLKRLTTVFDSCVTAFNAYKSTSQLYGKTGYNQILNLAPIKSFEKDGQGEADFKKDDVKIWDYKSWAHIVLSDIQKEIDPLRKSLVAYDIEINKLRDQLRKDSASISDQLHALQGEGPGAKLRKFDSNPMPLDLFGMKIAELQYASALVENRPYRDSVNVTLQLNMIEKEMRALKTFDSLTQKLLSRDLVEDAKDYQHFVESSYGTTDVLSSLIRGSSQFAKREREVKEAQLSKWREATRWVFVNNDSIPLFTDVRPTSNYQPLVVKEEKYTAGLKFVDSLATGYFHTITPSHQPAVSVDIPLQGGIFTKRKVPVTKGLAVSDEGGQLFYVLVYSEEKKGEKFPATVAKIYRTDGLAWTQEINLDLLPAELSYNDNTGELLIKTSGASGESKMVILDKNGKTL
ncbi:MAG: hypothetical protein AB7K37_15810 [Cyclobacteriaceae bacterium]